MIQKYTEKVLLRQLLNANHFDKHVLKNHITQHMLTICSTVLIHKCLLTTVNRSS